ncbi:AraC family transcriptional regulator [Saccharopolyspora sp. K220]|uniref:cupin domain-containing protein n=1 Tax=Saccharopolyspora soli TaxID=2926618 RepID=UPI001F58381C|nr:AraC family transcriptional regulator [Saccharopolyspora soli]MCI2423381.1 AraC family transcriptional regulator [Saccharopolyspora soli]
MDGVSRLIRLAHLEGGLDVRCLMAGQFTLENEAAGPGEVPFHLVLEGSCTVTTGSSAVDLGPGDLLLLTHGDAHQVTASSGRRRRFEDEPGPTFVTRRTVGAEHELDLFCGHYHFESAAGTLLFRLLPSLVHVTLDTPALTLADVLRGEAQFDGPGTGAVVCSLCDALLAMALRSRPDQRLDTPALWTAMGDDVLGRVIADIVERPGEPWTIDRMAAAASMSRATFLRRFTARTGTTVATLLTAIRMMVAADLLTRSDHSVARVASEVGYRSESAFAQAFRATVGAPPAQFRKNAVASG